MKNLNLELGKGNRYYTRFMGYNGSFYLKEASFFSSLHIKAMIGARVIGSFFLESILKLS